jgi:hypothetical protein
MTIGVLFAGTSDFLRGKFTKAGKKEGIPSAVIAAGSFLGASVFLILFYLFQMGQGQIAIPKPSFWENALITASLNVIMGLLIFLYDFFSLADYWRNSQHYRIIGYNIDSFRSLYPWL